MIDLFTWSTPNGRKVSIMLEELGLPYTVNPIDITKDQQFAPEFIRVNPNSKIPAIVDHEGPEGRSYTLFESGAILVYLAEKMKSDLWPVDNPRAKYRVLQWLMFQMGGVGPMFGQTHHFFKFARDDVPYAKNRYHDETIRLYEVMERRLHDAVFLAGEGYSIADIATYPWIARHDWHEVDLNAYPKLNDWFQRLSDRPAVEKGMKVPE